MKSLFYILVFLFSSEIIAQEFTISGSLIDKENAPIAYANILLLAEDETIVTGVSSNENGSFQLKNIASNTYKLKISFVGYKDFSETITLLKDENLGSITLQDDASALEEVTLTFKKPTLKKEADRLIFNVENTALSEGNLLEVLRSTPGVLVLDNAITVKNGTPTVYINDRKVNLSASEITQLLENSPANTIKKVEVITNPSAKYDAESGAVLNIVMSRNLITGYRGNVFTNYTHGVFPRYNAGVNQFYKTKKINVNLNYSYSQNKINRENTYGINYFDDETVDEKWNSNYNRNTRSKTHNLSLNFDYFLDDKNTLSFSSNALILPFYDYVIKGRTNVTDASNTSLFNFNSFNNSKDEKHNLGFDLDYEHHFENASKLTVNTHLTDYNYSRNQDVHSEYFYPDPDDNESTAFNTLSGQDTNIFTSQIDYSLPLSDSATFSTGVKSSNIETVSDIKQFDIDQSTNETTLNAANSNAYDYKESIFAAYMSYEKSWDKWSLSAGLRTEKTNIDGLSIATNTTNEQDYFELFPTANISWQATENMSLYTNYKRSISRPSYQLLNPFNFFLNDNTVVTGNPTLNPSLSNKYLLGTSLYDFLTIETFYKVTDNAFHEIPIQDNENNIIFYTPTNITEAVEYGLDIELYFNVTERWFLYLANSLTNSEETRMIDNTAVKLGNWFNYSIFSSDFSFLKDKSLSANLTLTHIGKNIIGFQTADARLVSDLFIKKTLFNKKATISLIAADLFNTQDYGVRTQYLNQDSSGFSDDDTRYIKLGFSYKFGNTTLKTNARTKALDELDRLEK